MHTGALDQDSNYAHDHRFSINDNINLHANEVILVKSGSVNIEGEQPSKFYQRHFDLDQMNESPARIENRFQQDQKLMTFSSAVQISNLDANDDHNGDNLGDRKLQGNKNSSDVNL
jgi:hypothetical protein